MNTQDVKVFFDRLASDWDAQQVDRSGVIETILDNAHIAAGQDVFDVACGTGVLFPYYCKRAVASVTGIDLSPNMVALAKNKFSDSPNIRILCGNVETVRPVKLVDQVMIYNAFPHFPDPQRLIAHLSSFVKCGGRLTVAHGMSRAQINSHHKGNAAQVSRGLLTVEEMQEMFEPYFTVDVSLSDDTMYQVSGVRKPL